MELPRGLFTPTALNPVLLMTSRSLATVTFLSSYLTQASPFSKLTLASSTPSVLFKACSTERAQPPQVIPVTIMMTVRVAAEEAPVATEQTRAKLNPLINLLLFTVQSLSSYHFRLRSLFISSASLLPSSIRSDGRLRNWCM